MKDKKKEIKKKPDYAALAAERLQTEVVVQVTARGKKDVRVRGTLLAFVPAGASLLESAVRADAELFRNMPEADQRMVRKTAAICVVRLTDTDGKVRFFTPRAQQVVW